MEGPWKWQRKTGSGVSFVRRHGSGVERLRFRSDLGYPYPYHIRQYEMNMVIYFALSLGFFSRILFRRVSSVLAGGGGLLIFIKLRLIFCGRQIFDLLLHFTQGEIGGGSFFFS